LSAAARRAGQKLSRELIEEHVGNVLAGKACEGCWACSPTAEQVAKRAELFAEPLITPVRIRCPRCRRLHVDIEEDGVDWAKRPHRTHRCVNTPEGPKTGCGFEWRPFEFHTRGI
jgi:hypothetical protein